MTRNKWLANQIRKQAKAWRKQDQGAWQHEIHEKLRLQKKTPWTERAIHTFRDDYGL